MFPIKDTIPARSFPVVNWLLIIANLAVFVLVELPLGPGQLERLVFTYGVVPAQCAGPLVSARPLASLAGEQGLVFGCAVPLFTSMFLHGGWLHIISNLWALFIFGDNVEDRMGSVRYLVFYLLSGLVAGLAQVAISPFSGVPAIGASGAIAGVLGAYLVLFPSSRVITLIPLVIIPWFVELPAILYLGIWFATQFYSGLSSVGASAGGGVAYWAHVGGFIFGLLLVWLFARPAPRRAYRRYAEEYRPW
jgi:membrane associated rhomboid family serine protease